MEVHVGTSMNVLGAEELIRGPDALNRKKGRAGEAENWREDPGEGAQNAAVPK